MNLPIRSIDALQTKISMPPKDFVKDILLPFHAAKTKKLFSPTLYFALCFKKCFSSILIKNFWWSI